MRADRLLALVLLLQHRGRMSAAALARELEVSTRTVLRDVEALSTAGIPVYAERGRAGGFALMEGFSTDLTGLTHDEALALLVAGRTTEAGMAPALAAAMRKVVAALPPAQRDSATRDAGRVLVRSEGFLPRTRRAADPDAEQRLAVVRRAVFAGRRLRIHYASAGGDPAWRAVDPVGLVGAGGNWYLLATRDGAERSYRMSRMLDAVELDEPADRPGDVDLERVWAERRSRFLSGRRAAVSVRLPQSRRARLARAGCGVISEQSDGDGMLRVQLEFADRAHAKAVLWTLAPDVEVLEPAALRAALATRASTTAALYS